LDAPLYNDWQLISLSPFPAWMLCGLALLVLGTAFLALRALRQESSRAKRALIGGLRLGSALVLFALFLEPGVRLMQTSRAKNRVAILLDRSASMSLAANQDGPTRFDRGRALLQSAAPFLDELSKNFLVELFTFGEALEPLGALDTLDTLKPEAEASDLLGALEQAARGKGASGTRKLSGAIVITDGADNRRLDEVLDARTRRAIEALDAPITTVLVGETPDRDVSVDRVAVDDFAFVRNSLTLTAHLRAPGFAGRKIPVLLRVDGRPLATQIASVPMGEDSDAPITVDFTFAPDRTGHFAYTVEVPLQDGEAIATNNELSFPLKVIRDRVRALHVSGRPTWDMRFLRGLLQEDPNIDLVSSYILRDLTNDPRVVSDSELSLIPFPMKEIFHDQIHTFDVIFIQNFSHEERAYSMSHYLDSIVDYVQAGGALVMLGGENSFGEGRYENTPLQAILPVVPMGRSPMLEPFQARLTPQGRHHPVMRVAATEEASHAVWQALPPMHGAHVTRAKPGTQVLLEHPFAKNAEAGQSVPLLVLGQAGEGRVMALLSDASWQWAFSADEAFTNARLYERFWAKAIRWLIRDPELTPVKLTLDKSALRPGEALAFQVEARRSDYTPARDAEIDVEIRDARDETLVEKRRVAAGNDGIARIEVALAQPGPYEIQVQGFEAGTPLGEDRSAFAVHPTGPEHADTHVRPKLLQEMATVSKGRFDDNPESLTRPPLTDPEVIEVGHRRDEPLGHQGIFLLVLAGLLGTEWLLRRRWGVV
jgi:uncharacterized membrane protein